MASMKEASDAVRYFKNLQRDHGFKDSSSIVQNKWNMKDIIEDVDNDADLKKLMMFFIKNSDDKTFKHFAYKYAEYYETMLDVIAQRKRDRALLLKTSKKD